MRLFQVMSTIFLAMLVAGCASQGSRTDFAIPGCEAAWNRIGDAKLHPQLKTLVTGNCPELYAKGWRLPLGKGTAGAVQSPACTSAMAAIEAAGLTDDTAYLVSHNCPVFYRKAWVVPPR